jgi:hypothetical protein
MNSLYLSRAVLASYDGEGTGLGAAGAADPGTTGAAGAGTGAGATGAAGAGAMGAAGAGTAGAAGDVKFTPEQQEKLNALLAEDRRKHQARLEKTIQEMQARANLTQQEREQLAQQLDDLRKEGRTAKQQAEFERQQMEKEYQQKLADIQKARDEWEARYRVGTVEQALQEAAVKGDANSPDVLMAVLRPMTRLTEVMDPKTGKGTGKFEVKVDFADIAPETGEPYNAIHTPETAVKRMKEIEKYGHLFRSGAIGGVGSNSATGGLLPGGGKKVDVRNLTQEQYVKIRAEHPEWLGLRPPKRGAASR